MIPDETIENIESDWNEYPKIECDEHGMVETAYLICVHVIKQGKGFIHHFEKATSKDIGMVCCNPCFNKRDTARFTIDDYALYCRYCAEHFGYILNIQ